MQEQVPASNPFPSTTHLKKLHQSKLREGDKPGQEQKSLQIKLFWQNELIRIEHFDESKTVTLGPQRSCEIPLAIQELESAAFALITPSAQGHTLHWADWMQVAWMNESGTISLASQNKEQSIELGLHQCALIQVGPLFLVVQYVRPARPFRYIWKSAFDTYFSKVVTLSIIAHAFFIAALLLTPLVPLSLSENLEKTPNRFATLGIDQSPKPICDLKDISTTKPTMTLSGGAHKEEAGKLGKPNTSQKQAAASKPGAPTVNPNSREEDRKIASASGIFSVLQGMKKAETSSVFGPGGLGNGLNNALGGLEGTNHGDTAGAGGLGTRGTGPGGGGESIGIGGLGNGSGIGPGGEDLVTSALPGKKRIQVKPQRIQLKGCLKPTTVRRVLSRYQSQARYCYEKELTRNPNLAGKVTAEFIIGPTGSVLQSKIQSTSLQNSNVEKCLIRSVNKMKFPACQGGGNAYVTYPWIFQTN